MAESKWWHGILYGIADKVLVLWLLSTVGGFFYKPLWSVKLLVNAVPVAAILWELVAVYRRQSPISVSKSNSEGDRSSE